MGMKLPPDLERRVLELDINRPKAEPPKPQKTKRPARMAPAGWSVTLKVPVAVKSEMNQRDHWTVRRDRFKAQAHAASMVWVLSPLHGWSFHSDLPLTITLTHIGSIMDDDNLAGAFKGVRDWLAGKLGVDDGSDSIRWLYEQHQSRMPSIEIRIEKTL